MTLTVKLDRDLEQALARRYAEIVDAKRRRRR